MKRMFKRDRSKSRDRHADPKKEKELAEASQPTNPSKAIVFASDTKEGKPDGAPKSKPARLRGRPTNKSPPKGAGAAGTGDSKRKSSPKPIKLDTSLPPGPGLKNKVRSSPSRRPPGVMPPTGRPRSNSQSSPNRVSSGSQRQTPKTTNVGKQNKNTLSAAAAQSIAQQQHQQQPQLTQAQQAQQAAILKRTGKPPVTPPKQASASALLIPDLLDDPNVGSLVASDVTSKGTPTAAVAAAVSNLAVSNQLPPRPPVKQSPPDLLTAATSSGVESRRSRSMERSNNNRSSRSRSKSKSNSSPTAPPSPQIPIHNVLSSASTIMSNDRYLPMEALEAVPFTSSTHPLSMGRVESQIAILSAMSSDGGASSIMVPGRTQPLAPPPIRRNTQHHQYNNDVAHATDDYQLFAGGIPSNPSMHSTSSSQLQRPRTAVVERMRNAMMNWRKPTKTIYDDSDLDTDLDTDIDTDGESLAAGSEAGYSNYSYKSEMTGASDGTTDSGSRTDMSSAYTADNEREQYMRAMDNTGRSMGESGSLVSGADSKSQMSSVLQTMNHLNPIYDDEESNANKSRYTVGTYDDVFGDGDENASTVLQRSQITKEIDVFFVRQQYGYFSISVSILQFFLLTVIFASCGVAPISVNPMVGPYPDALSYWGGKNAYLVVNEYEYWRLLSPVVLHSGVLHLLGNVAIQLETGAFFEREWGSRIWLVVYLSSAMGGTLLSCVAEPDSVSVGSSGAVMGLFGAKIAEVFCRSCQVGTENNSLKHNTHIEQLSGIFCSGTIVSLFTFIPFVDWSSHLGGLMTGFSVGLLLFAFQLKNQINFAFWGLLGAGAVAFLVFSFAAAIVNVSPPEGLRDVCDFYRGDLYQDGYECTCSPEGQYFVDDYVGDDNDAGDDERLLI